MFLVITSSAGAVEKYCNEHVCVCVCVCVSVCMSVREHIPRNTLAIFDKLNLLCMLPIAVARSSSGAVTQSQRNG